MTTTNQRKFLQDEIGGLLKNLKAETDPSFGLMTAQHMIEHLIMMTKVSVKRYGNPEPEPTKGQLGFQRFIEKGAIFKHRVNDKTKEDLPELKYGSLEEAIEQMNPALDRFYNHFDSNPEFKNYNPIMGELNFEQLQLFHYQHYRYHFWQFGLLPEYP